MGRIIGIDELLSLKKELKEQNKKIVFTNGCFDILHIGHTRYLKASKSYGDILVVGLNSDASVRKLKGETRPVNNQNDRAEILSELNFVDYVIIFDDLSPVKILQQLKPDIYTKGADYNMENLPEAPILIKNNIKAEFINLIEGKSTTNVINKIEKN